MEIYLDYNATTPIDKEVLNEMLPYMHTYFGNPSSSYSIGRKSKETIIRAREQLAGLIGANPEEIIFTSGGTESNNHAIRGAALANKVKGKHIVTSSVEHPSVTEVCRYLDSEGFDITYLPVDNKGVVHAEEVAAAIRPDTILISIMHANNEVGAIQPIGEVSEIAKKNNVLFHTDASQSAGKINTNVAALGVDLLTLAGHKLYAPKGIGALYIREGVKIENLMYGGGQESGIRPGTENVIQIAGLGKACEIAGRDLNRNRQLMSDMRIRLLEGLTGKHGNRVILNTDLDNSLPNTLSLAFENVEAHTLTSVIGHEVFISTGSACHADITEISPVLEAMNIQHMTAASTVRISTGKNTTKEEVDRAVDIISDAVNKLSM